MPPAPRRRRGNRVVSAELISIIGPPAAGKTTLAERLAERLGAGLIREDYAGNPFLAAACAGDRGASLPSQLYFLMSRVRQLAETNWPAGGLFVSDYGFCQDRIYARARLDAEQMRVYDPLARRAEALVRRPRVLVCLDAREQTLLERIRRRGRAFEMGMTAEFLAEMRAAYRGLATDGPCRLIRLDCDAADPTAEPHAEELVAEIRRAL